MKKGEIWIVNSENSNGHEQSDIRPAVVVSGVVGRVVIDKWGNEKDVEGVKL